MSVAGTERHWALIPADLAKKLKPRVLRIGDGLVTLLANSDSLRMNRVIGLGHRGRASEAMIDEIIVCFRAARIRRFSVLMSPGPQAKAIAVWLDARGFQRDGGHSMLARACDEPVPSAKTDLRVLRARRSDAATMVAIQQKSFGIPRSRRAWSLAAAVSPAYDHYLAYEGRKPVAVASMRVEDGLAWLGGAATLTSWRGRGAQSGLIAVRLRRAARAGCRWAWVETAMLEPHRPSVSRRNLLRMGFEEVAVKPSWIWAPR